MKGCTTTAETAAPKSCAATAEATAVESASPKTSATAMKTATMATAAPKTSAAAMPSAAGPCRGGVINRDEKQRAKNQRKERNEFRPADRHGTLRSNGHREPRVRVPKGRNLNQSIK